MDVKRIASYAVTITFIVAAIYIAKKHYQEPGFWYGVLALALLGSYFRYDSPDVSVKVGSPQEGVKG